MSSWNFVFLVSLVVFISCRSELSKIPFDPTPYEVKGYEALGKFFPYSKTNPMTEEGLKLGQHLFYDPILSNDGTMSCASCHKPELAFTDGKSTSVGTAGIQGTRSSMSLVNAAYYVNGLFWDGRETTLENQAVHPVSDPIELNQSWEDLLTKLRKHESYPKMFRKAFGIDDVDDIQQDLVVKALAQFQRNIVSANSIYDQVRLDQTIFTEEEDTGRKMFFDQDQFLPDAECGHCHNGVLLSSNEYFDNGVQEEYEDIGYGKVTNNSLDDGKFRAPTLRNIALTAPYMHDGRFKTLEEVIEHYNDGGHGTPNQDPLIRPLNLNEAQKEALISFLHTLTDTSYLENEYVTNPFE